MTASLPDVTLMAADHNPQLAMRSIERCCDAVEFRSWSFATKFDSYNEFCLRQMARHIQTSHVLIVQYDSWIIYPEMWSDEFLEYDYIGAKWPWHKDGHNVGNGGFSLRSKKLLDILASWKYEKEVIEDDFICRASRSQLEEAGIKFAPESIADRFSYERAQPEGKTFGFHGLYNLWRHVDDADMIRMAALFPDYVVKKREYHELIANYRSLRKFDVVEALCKRLA